jgi:hypothetical protein
MSMTLGKDVSALFPDVLKNIATADLDQKKLVYLYLMLVHRVASHGLEADGRHQELCQITSRSLYPRCQHLRTGLRRPEPPHTSISDTDHGMHPRR